MVSPDGAQGAGFGFVGRQRELDRLVEAMVGPPAVVLVEGEAGIGKSRLVAEAAAAVRGRPVLTGYCHPLREPLPFGPVVDALRAIGPLLPPADRIPPSAGALAPLLPDLADRLPPPPPVAGAAPNDRHRLVQAVRAVLGAIGEAVLVVEDVHWVDDATRELLLLLARDLPPGLALVLTYRGEDLPPDTPVLGAAYRRPPGIGGALIRPAPLAESEVHELARAALGPRATAALARVLFDRSEGLPLVAEEDLITLCEEGRPGLTDAADLASDLEHSEVPRGLHDAVTERLAALSPTAGAVVEAVAVLGVPADEELVAAVAGLDGAAAAEGLIEALRVAALHEAAPSRYAFRHALAQQVAYRRIPGPQRAALHRRAVRALETREPRPLVQIAHHTQALGDRRAWQVVAEAAADQAVALGDTGSAGALLRRLLAEPDLDAEQRGRAALALARIAANGVDLRESARILGSIIADPRLSTADRGEIRFSLGMQVAVHGGDRAGFAEIERAAEELLADRPARAARALVALAMNERDGGGARARGLLDRANALLADSPEPEVAAAVLATRLTILAREGDPAVWAELEPLPRTSDNPEIVRQTTRALYNVGDIAVDLGHDARSGLLLAESRRLARLAAIPYLECYSRIVLLRLDGLAGRWDGIEDRFAALGAEFPDLALAGSERALLLGRLAAARGRLALAQEEYAAAAEYGERESQVTTALRAAAGLAALRLAEGDAERAAEVVAPAVRALRDAAAWARSGELLPVAVEALLAVGDLSGAERLVADAATGLAGVDAPAAFAALALARGLLLEAGGEAADAPGDGAGTGPAGAPAADGAMGGPAAALPDGATGGSGDGRAVGSEDVGAAGRSGDGATGAPAAEREAAAALPDGVTGGSGDGRAVGSEDVGREPGGRAGRAAGLRGAAALEAFREARDRWRGIGRPYEATRAEERVARALAITDPAAAADRLVDVEDAYTALGAASDAARCRHARRDLGLGRTASPGRRGYGEGLSPRERQVAELVAQGASNQDVAQALFLSPRTVEHHVANVLRKLGVGRRDLRDALARHPADG
ncbi:helix-turn-helix transcriptional regulator [Kitasatospora terrestris]|uniref:HTH luxR-type domain-containing protein n=1 Tax=Kitasatospora terrestris TaxID=258051 RepID=A0ABP9DKK7_9ACTN